MIIEGLDDLNKAFSSIKEAMKSPQLQKARAEKFKDAAPRIVGSGAAGMKPNKSATRKIQGIQHSPESWTGELVGAIEVRVDPTGAEAGYFSDSTKKPGPRTLADGAKSQSNLSFAEIAMLQTSGFRIPLSGPSGAKVRGFLARYGIFLKATKAFLVVSARPFLTKAADVHEGAGGDEMAVDQFFEAVWGNL